MADITIPFNNDPVSTTVRTTSYTIPAGKYARVRATQFGSDFKLDSNVVIQAHRYNGTFNATNSGQVPFTNNTDYLLVGTVIKEGSGSNAQFSIANISSTVSGDNPYSGATMQSPLSTAAASVGAVMAPGDRIYVDTASGGGVSIEWSLSAVNPEHETTFWVPSGTLIEGDTFVVEEYNIIT